MCGTSTWKGTVVSWTWISGMRLLTSDVGDIGVHVLSDSKEMKTEKE